MAWTWCCVIKINNQVFVRHGGTFLHVIPCNSRHCDSTDVLNISDIESNWSNLYPEEKLLELLESVTNEHPDLCTSQKPSVLTKKNRSQISREVQRKVTNRIYSDRSELDLSNETIKIRNFHYSQKLCWKNCWKLPKCYVSEKRMVSKLSKISIPNFDSTSWRLK